MPAPLQQPADRKGEIAITTASHSFQSTITGASEGGTDLINLQITNTSAVYAIQHTTLATNGITGAIVAPLLSTGVRQVFIVPPSTNTMPMRLGNTTADSTGHLSISSSDPTIISVSSLSTVVLWSTGATVISGVRIIQT